MKLPVLLFELGYIQVFTLLSANDIAINKEYNEVYWQDKISRYSYGPFKSIYDCMTHYTTVIANQKVQIIGKQQNAQVIYVDFHNRRRIQYE